MNYFNVILNKIVCLLLLTVLFAGCDKVNEEDTTENKLSHAGIMQNEYDFNLLTTPGHYTIATYNVRRTTTDDTGNRSWATRRPLVKNMILTYGFDIFGVQEPMGPQIDNMIADLSSSGYAKFGVSDHNDHAYQHQDIFYKTAKFTLLANGKFWLAPGAPSSVPGDTTPWDNYYHVPVVTWGKFQDKATGQIFFVFNAHFNPGAPNGGSPTAEVAMQESANLMLTKIPAVAGNSPVIFMGDLNRNQTTAQYATLNNSALLQENWDVAAAKTPVSRQTGNWWVLNPSGNSQIDHIFVTNQWVVAKRVVHWDNYSGVLPSDHFPVSADMKLPAPINLNPLADACARDGVPYGDQNFGTASVLTVKSAPSTGFSRKAALKFDLNGVSSVSQAILRVYGRNIESSAAVGINLQSTGDAWAESTVTWNTDFPSGSYIGTASVNNTAKYYDWDVTAFVQSQVSGDKIASFVMYQATNANLTTDFNSRESASNKPVLVITP